MYDSSWHSFYWIEIDYTNKIIKECLFKLSQLSSLYDVRNTLILWFFINAKIGIWIMGESAMSTCLSLTQFCFQFVILTEYHTVENILVHVINLFCFIIVYFSFLEVSIKMPLALINHVIIVK